MKRSRVLVLIGAGVSAVTLAGVTAGAVTPSRTAATPQRGGSLTIARREDSRVVRSHERLPERVDLAGRADHGAAVHEHHRRQEPAAMACDQLHGLERRQDLHVQAAVGREVLERKSDELGRREVLDRPGAREHQGVGLHRRRDQERRRPDVEHGRHPPQVPVGAVPVRRLAVRERRGAEGLRRCRPRRRSTRTRSGRGRSCGTSASSARPSP